MLRFVLAAFLSGMVCTAALAAVPTQESPADPPEAPDQVFTSALRQSIGSPARAELDGQATERLADGFLIVPHEYAAKLLTATNRDVPPNLTALLLGSEGMQAPGIVRFVAAGFIDADAALSWTQDDMLASLKETVERGNAVRVKDNLPEREVRRWVQPPRYDPESHQLSWSALILPKSAPRESDGEITFYAIGFGREGYVELSAMTSEQKADDMERMAASFLTGLNFLPGKAYGDVQATDRRAPDALAGAMGLVSLHKSQSNVSIWSSDIVVPVAGGIVAAIGAMSLFLYVQRHLRRESRRG